MYVLNISSQFPNLPITQNGGMESMLAAECSLNKDSIGQIEQPKHLGYYLTSTLQICLHITLINIF